MNNRHDLRCRLAYPNVQAFLAVIRAALQTPGPADYRSLPDGTYFSGWHHPGQGPDLGMGGARAGAYRLPARLWDALAMRYGFPDFAPDCQDEAAVAILELGRALHHVLNGHFFGALEAARVDWPELPMKGKPGRLFNAARAVEIYQQHGGHFLPAHPIAAHQRPAVQSGRVWRDVAGFLAGFAIGAAIVTAAAWSWLVGAP